MDWQDLLEPRVTEMQPDLPGRLDQLCAWIAERAYRLGLTNYGDPRAVADQAVVPALAVLRLPRWPQEGRFLEIGAGSGVAGLALGMVFPGLEVTALDRRERAARFIALSAARLGVGNVRAVCADARSLARREPQGYQVVGFRALAGAETALELALPLLAPEGMVLAWHREGDEGFLRPQAALSLTATIGTGVSGLSLTQYLRTG